MAALLTSCASDPGELPAAKAPPLFSDSFEQYARLEHPGKPWSEATFKSGAEIHVDADRAYSGEQALHVRTPAGAKYRRGYVAIHFPGTIPEALPGFYGRAMVWLKEAPQAVPGAPSVQWTLLQGEGRSADDTYNPIYRLGVQEQGGTQLMANYETTPPVTTDCKQQSGVVLPQRRWACVEFHFEVATNELQFWLDGEEVAHVVGRGDASTSCRGNDLKGEWRAPPRFNSLYLGFERYADSANDQNLWIDDVELSKERVGCPRSENKE